MADFFRNLKGKLSETIKDLSAPPDPYERKLTEHVERATSDLLMGPDWGLNFELIDSINNDPQGASDKVYRAMRKCLLKPSIQTQLLTLNLLEACVKNCVPFFHQQLIYSDLWQEIMKAGEPMRNWDAEVRDKALALVEDFGRGLPLPAYREAYESLLDRGVDFPVRPDQAADGGAPYYSPPPVPAAAVAASQGISPEDRAAIAAAVADLEAQAVQQEARDASLAPPGLPSAGHVPALMGPAVLMGAPIRPPGYHPPAGYHPPHQPAVQPAMVAGAEPIVPHAHGTAAAGAAAAAGGGPGSQEPGGVAIIPRSREEVEQALRVSRNSAELLGEMLAPIRTSSTREGLQETFVADLVDQCYRYKSVIHELIPRIAEEDLISAALLANDELSRVLNEYETLSQGAPTAATRSSGGGSSAGAAAAAAAAGAAAAGLSAGGIRASSSSGGGGPFTLLGEDEDDGGVALQSSRGQPVPAAAGARAAASQEAAGRSSGGDQLISFDAPPPASAPAIGPGAAASGPAGLPAATSSTTTGGARLGEEQLVDQMDQLLLSAQPPPAPASQSAGDAAAPAAASAGTRSSGSAVP